MHPFRILSPGERCWVRKAPREDQLALSLVSYPAPAPKGWFLPRAARASLPLLRPAGSSGYRSSRIGGASPACCLIR